MREARTYLQRTRLRSRIFIRGIAQPLAEELREIIRIFFARQAGPDGPWPPLSEFTVQQKGHDTILYETGRLERSLTGITPDSIIVVRDLYMRFGTRVPYAYPHQYGDGLPLRRFMPEPHNYVGRLSQMAADYIVRHGDNIRIGIIGEEGLHALGRGIF